MSAKHLSPDEHPFHLRPHRTIWALAIPVTMTVIAEPITGLVDTAFVARLGAVPLAALGVGTATLSMLLWIFNFLGISTQTEIARAHGGGSTERAARLTGLALLMALLCSALVMLLFIPGAPFLSALLGAEGAVLDEAVVYLRVRLLGAPAVIGLFVTFGAMRGLQDMRTPLLIALGINGLNIALDGPLIFGWLGLPALGVGGAALASSLAQWLGFLASVMLVRRRLGLRWHLAGEDVRALFKVGGDMFVRTGLLTLFIILTTRVANQISPEAGAAHQAVRTVWLFLGLFMDGFAVTAQSLVGYFLGADRLKTARRTASLAAWWSLGIGTALGVLMVLATEVVAFLFVPEEALALFGSVWLIAALTQPLMGLAFATDGIHWGTGDYGWLRNAMIAATASGALALSLIEPSALGAFQAVWWATLLWVTVRAIMGTVRVWPGVGRHPLKLA